MKALHVMIGAALILAGCGGPSASNPETAAPAPAAGAKPPAPAGAQPVESAAAPASSPVAAAKPKAKPITLDSGATLRVRTTTALSTKTAEAGQAFTATLAEPLLDGNRVIAPKGATVEGKVSESDDGGKVKGLARIAVTLTALHVGSRAVPVSTNAVAREARSTKKKDAVKVGIGAGIGAAIGAIAGGGKGAAIGSATGAGAGTGVVLATKGDPAVIPAESLLTFRLTSPAVIPAVE